MLYIYMVVWFGLGTLADNAETIWGDYDETLAGTVQCYMRTVGNQVHAIGVVLPSSLVYNTTLASVCTDISLRVPVYDRHRTKHSGPHSWSGMTWSSPIAGPNPAQALCAFAPMYATHVQQD